MEMAARRAIHRVQNRRRNHLENPALKMALLREFAGEPGRLFRTEINQDSLAHDQDPLGAAVDFLKEGRPFLAVQQIEPDAFEPATRRFAGQNFFFVSEDFRCVDFDPAKRGRQGHAIRPGV
jgi:hypothetical protein